MAEEAENPVCARCKVTSSLMWEKNKEGEVLCLECHSNSRPSGRGGADLPPSHSNRESAAAPDSSCNSGRRTRLRNAKGRYGKAPEKTKAGNTHTPSSVPTNSASSTGAGNPPANSAAYRKGGVAAGRRSLSKMMPKKAPTLAANVISSDSILHKGTKYEVGDIVSILDESGRVYYGLLRGFLVDQYSEKYAVLTWLIPTTPNPKNFDPSLFVLGPEEDSPKDMECLEFVSHSPQSAGFLPSLSRDTDLAKLWNSKRRRIMFTS